MRAFRGRTRRVALRLALLALPVAVTAADPGLSDPLPEPGDRLILTFAGDIMHHDQTAVMNDYDTLYDAVRPLLLRDDLSFANIEFPVDPGRAPSGYPRFNGTIKYVGAAIRGGFDVFALANNHTFDWGRESAEVTARVFADLETLAGVHSNGIRRFPMAPIDLTVIRQGVWRVGFVSVTAFSNLGGASGHINQVNYLDDAVREGFLAQVRRWAERVDLLVVGIHAGVEYVTTPDTLKAAFFQDVARAGAHIVWGHHPHVLQPWEILEHNGRQALIMYSTGNFISAQRRYQSPSTPVGRWAPTGDTALYQVTVTRLPSGPVIAAVETPVLTTHWDDDGGYVLRWFPDVLARPLSVQWRAFYLARYAAVRRLVDQ